MSINKAFISGNLTRDPDLRSTANGTAVLQISVAVNDRRKNQQTGEWEDYPNYVECIMFGNRADSVSRILFKGTKVSIEGKLRWSQWEKNGEKRNKLEVVIEEIEVMAPKKQGESVKAEIIEPQATINFNGQKVALYEDEVPF